MYVFIYNIRTAHLHYYELLGFLIFHRMAWSHSIFDNNFQTHCVAENHIKYFHEFTDYCVMCVLLEFSCTIVNTIPFISSLMNYRYLWQVIVFKFLTRVDYLLEVLHSTRKITRELMFLTLLNWRLKYNNILYIYNTQKVVYFHRIRIVKSIL